MNSKGNSDEVLSEYEEWLENEIVKQKGSKT